MSEHEREGLRGIIDAQQREIDTLRAQLAEARAQAIAEVKALLEQCSGSFVWHVIPQLAAVEAANITLDTENAQLRQALRVIRKGLSDDADGEFWPARRWLDTRNIYHGDLSGNRVLELVAKHTLHGEQAEFTPAPVTPEPGICDCPVRYLERPTNDPAAHDEGCAALSPLVVPVTPEPPLATVDHCCPALGPGNYHCTQFRGHGGYHIAAGMTGNVFMTWPLLASEVRPSPPGSVLVSRKDAGWKPIETAPKDADILLLSSPSEGVQPGYWYDREDPHCWVSVETQGLTGGRMQPTHWMPLPLGLPVEGQ